VSTTRSVKELEVVVGSKAIALLNPAKYRSPSCKRCAKNHPELLEPFGFYADYDAGGVTDQAHTVKSGYPKDMPKCILWFSGIPSSYLTMSV
jgi:hypothetical protein